MLLAGAWCFTDSDPPGRGFEAIFTRTSCLGLPQITSDARLEGTTALAGGFAVISPAAEIQLPHVHGGGELMAPCGVRDRCKVSCYDPAKAREQHRGRSHIGPDDYRPPIAHPDPTVY